MATANQLDFDFSNDFLNVTAPAVSVPKPSNPDRKAKPAITETENEAGGFNFEPVTRNEVTDYSPFPANRIYIANEKTILKSNAPPWIPPLDQAFMRANSFMPPVLKDKDTYLMASSYNLKKMYRLSLDGLAATVDYYTKYQKALNNQEAKNTAARRVKEAREWLENKGKSADENPFYKRYYEKIIREEHKIRPKPVRMLPVNRMTTSQMNLFIDNGLKKDQVWDAYRVIKEEVRQKMLDMSCQIEDLQSSYAKGTETSYGNKNTNDSLKETYGVLVKRQNGDAINRKEIEDIAGALDKIRGVFGDLKTISREYGLKISHAGEKNMYARKAVGLFFNVHRAIGISFANKDSDFLIMAHEYSHFLDSRAGKTLDHFFASDKPGSPENAVAREFRTVMNKRDKKTVDSKYLNRTCECFARAVEQYTAYKLSREHYKQYCNSESYASDDVFTKNIVPLVETLMTERRDFWRGVPPDEGMAKLKAFGIALEDNTGPQFKNNFLSLLGSTEYRGKPMEAAQFLIKN
ncbi:MAG: hypothetical protein LBH57_02005, partial [Treponema sp.]|nr:hypothetical protein [Treponema sp.]